MPINTNILINELVVIRSSFVILSLNSLLSSSYVVVVVMTVMNSLIDLCWLKEQESGRKFEKRFSLFDIHRISVYSVVEPF